MSTDLDYIFNPRSIVVIGASNKEGKWGFALLQNIVSAGFEGEIYPVNPREAEVQNIRAYKSVLDIAGPVDLAVVGVPAKVVPGVLRECTSKGVKGLVVVAAGFAETGEEGRQLEEEIAAILRESGMRMVGPNCVGVISSSSALNATPLPYTTGSLAFITQSGNLTNDVEFVARKRGLGFSKLISFGNQTDVQFHEYIDYVKDDRDTLAVMLYVEQVKDGKSFMQTVRETVKQKPVIAIKVGETSTGIRAAESHTGSLTGSYQVYKAAFRQLGIIEASDSNDLIDIAESLTKLPLMQNKRIVVLTDGGGHGAMACDAAEKLGLLMPVLPEQVQSRLRDVLLPQSIALNPVDFAGAAEADLWSFIRCSEIILQEAEVDGLLIVGALFGGYAAMFGLESLEVDVARGLCDLVARYNKPIIMHCPYPVEEVAALRALRSGGIPVYPRIETAARCMAALSDYGTYLRKIEKEEARPRSGAPGAVATGLIGAAKAAGRSSLLETEARQILREYGLPVGDFRLAGNRDAAVVAAQAIGYPVVAKVVSPQILHKSDAGAVRLDLKDDSEVRRAFDEIIGNSRMYDANAQIEGVMITAMEKKGLEVIIGAAKDPQFGPVVMFGLGGVFVEVLKDLAFRIPPLARRDAEEMLREIKGYPVLEGTRGEEARDIDSLVDIIMAISKLVVENQSIAEVDLNPVVSFQKGASIVDARIILE